MDFFFDESGDFRVPTGLDHAVGIAVGIVIPDETKAAIMRRYDDFVRGLSPGSFHQNEPKGNLLDTDGRRDFAEFISASDGLLVSPIMLDLTALSGKSGADLQASVIRRLEALSRQSRHPTFKEQVNLLARQIKNLSLEQLLRLGTWARCVRRAINDSVIAHREACFRNSWETIRFEIDPVQRSAASREEQIFNTMLLAWVCAWSQNEPLTTIEEFHDGTHPLMRNFATTDGIDLGKMVKGNLHYPQSRASKGLQIADLAASLVAAASRGIANAADLKNYGLMMAKSIGRPLDAVGIFSIVPTHVREWPRRFYGLPESIDAARKAQSCG
jgi:hypothetical protein